MISNENNIQEIKNLSNEKRIYYLQENKWIGYTRSKKILDKLDDILNYPDVYRMPSLLIVGDTNNGKTAIVHRFCSLNPSQIIENEERFIRKVIYLQAPPIPDEKRFYNSLLVELWASFKFNDKIDKKINQAHKLLREINTKIIIIDEIHNILAGSLSKQRAFLNIIKQLSNELYISIIGVGTREAFNAIGTDPQLTNRFEPAILPKWQLNEEYLRLLKSFEKTLPLKEESKLTERDIAIKILSLSEGTIGEINKVIMLAAIDALKNKQEKITMNILEKIDYISPSARRKAIQYV